MMTTIGLIGGITWQSTIMYYEVLNRLAARHFGGSHSAKCLIHSVEFGEIARLQKEEAWDRLGMVMADAAKSLENGGAALILICANTMHLCIEDVRAAVNIPVIHIVDATAHQILAKNISKVALLGTKYTMEKDFYKDALQNHNIDVIIPELEVRNEIHRIIYEEMSKGVFNESAKRYYLDAIQGLIDQGAQGIVLGCTEIPILIQQEDVAVPIFDTTTIHSTAGFRMSIAEK